jgi:hypothetical protein
MRRFRFIKNKYSLSVLILVCCLLVDIVLHKGMSRVIIPEEFTEKIAPVRLPLCQNPLQQKGKEWVKGINTIGMMNGLPADAAGIETDVYFDEVNNCFYVYHDSSARSELNADTLLSAYHGKKLTATIWFDLKNLNPQNKTASLAEINRLKNKYKLSDRLIIQSSDAASLRSFCDSGFFTSYSVPFFNPYRIKEEKLVRCLRKITNDLSLYPASSVSGYYFQYPVLKKFFPNYPILTWSDNSSVSLVAFLFNRHLLHDDMVKVVLFPYKD